MSQSTYAQFVTYLQDELAVSKVFIEQALQQIGEDLHLLPIALWQYNRITLTQLGKSYDWLALDYKKQELSAIFSAY